MPAKLLGLPARSEFPLADKVLYLNSSLQQPLSQTVKEACTDMMEEHLLEPTPKGEWYARTEELRAKMSAFIGAEKQDICFTKNTSDGINHFIHSRQWNAGDNVVLLDGEHPNQGLEVRRIPQVNFANADTFASAVDEKTCAIGISWVMFHSGQKNDVADICTRYRPRGIEVLVDATQGVGVLKLDVEAIKPSALAFSCHKALGTPAGFGVLYLDPTNSSSLRPAYLGPNGVTDCPPTLIAGHSVDNLQPGALRFEVGNLNYMAIHAAAAYLELLDRVGGIQDVEDYLYRLSQRIIEGLAALGIGTVAEDDRDRRSPHNVVFDLFDAGWVPHLNGCLVSHYRAGMRVSLGMFNDNSDIDRFISLIKSGLAKGIPAR